MFKVAEGLACGTPHMISATIEGLARLAYEFSDLVSTASNLLPSTFLHIPTRSQEIIKVCSLSFRSEHLFIEPNM